MLYNSLKNLSDTPLASFDYDDVHGSIEQAYVYIRFQNLIQEDAYAKPIEDYFEFFERDLFFYFHDDEYDFETSYVFTILYEHLNGVLLHNDSVSTALVNYIRKSADTYDKALVIANYFVMEAFHQCHNIPFTNPNYSIPVDEYSLITLYEALTIDVAHLLFDGSRASKEELDIVFYDTNHFDQLIHNAMSNIHSCPAVDNSENE